jgi:oligopeptide transport system substrate-binding protein
LDGHRAVNELGVRAIDDHTLTITLEHRSPLFLERLAATAAMPCNQAAFQEAKGRYGLEKQFVMANGPFALEGWTDKQLTLRPNQNHGKEHHLTPPAVYLYIGREDERGRFLAGNTDLAEIPFSDVPAAQSAEKSINGFMASTWCIVFNQNDANWGNPFLRQGLALAIDRDIFSARLPENLSPADHLIPPAISLLEQSFRALAPRDPPLAFDGQKAARLFRMGLEALGLPALPATDLYVPDGGGHAVNMGLLQQSWQRHLDTYINIVAEPPEELEERFLAGDFQLLLMPFTPDSPRVESIIEALDTPELAARLGYRNPRLPDLIAAGKTASTPDGAILRFSQAERTLLADAVVIPVYHEAIWFATGRDVSGLEIYPYGGVYFRDGYRS